MIKKTITYENFEGEEVTVEAWFHAYKTVLLEVTDKIEQLSDTEQTDKAFELTKDILVRTYGRRVGDLFMQDEDTVNQLRYTNMLDQLIIDLLSNTDEMLTFMVGIMPKDINKALRTTPEGIKTLAEAKAKIDELKNEDQLVDEDVVEDITA